MTPHTSHSFQVVEVCVTLPYLHGTWCYIHPSSIPFQIRSTKIKTTLSNKHGIVGEKQIASTSVKTMHDPLPPAFLFAPSFLSFPSHPIQVPLLLYNHQVQKVFQRPNVNGYSNPAYISFHSFLPILSLYRHR